MSALVVVTVLANWRGVQEARELGEFQLRAEESFDVSRIGEAVARERALRVRAQTGTARATAASRSQAATVDELIMRVSRSATQARDRQDIGGRLDAVRRQLFAVRLRASSANASDSRQGYGQVLDSLEAIQRDLTAQPPTRDVATAAFADLAMRAALEAGRREQVELWSLMRRPQQAANRVASSNQWAALEQSALNAFRSAAPSADIADLNAVIFSPPGLYVRRVRAQLVVGVLPSGPAQTAEWWRESSARSAALTSLREGTRNAVATTVADNRSAAWARVWQTMAFSALVIITVLTLGLLLRRSIARSLQGLARSAEALSAGELQEPLTTTGHDEIAAVGQAVAAVRFTNRRLVAELHAMNAAIAAEQLTHRADAGAFRGSWADVLDGMNDTMSEVTRLHDAAADEVQRQKAFGLVGRSVVSGISLDDAYRQCCQLLVDQAGAVRAEVYEQTPQGWQRRMLAGAVAEPSPPERDVTSTDPQPSAAADARVSLVRAIGEVECEPVAALKVEFSQDALPASDVLFVDGVTRLLNEASHRRAEEDTRLRAQKLEATGTMAAAIAHDFNNVLGAILNNAHLGQLETKDPQAAETFATISGAVGRASEIVKRLLSFARSEPPSHDAFTLAALVDDACALLRPGLPSHIALHSDVDDGLPAIVGDSTRIHQVVVNLITNAAQALGSTPGTITVTGDEITIQSAGVGPTGAAGRYARIRVHDTGPGIPDDVAQRVFDPFFTTKPKGEGTGLGLAAALTIARDHHGTIDIGSAPGGGTTATLCLPIGE